MSEPILSVADLVYRYPDGTAALNGVTFTVARNQTVGLMGANGAGKSTLLMAVAALIDAEGAVIVDGLRLDRTTQKACRRSVGIVFQNPDDQLFLPTVAEDVAFGPRNMGLADDEIARRVIASLAAVGLADVADRSPHHLSFGQKKRAALATVLSMRPPLLLLDEPTAGLDPRGRRELIELLRRLPGAKVIATHDFGLVRAVCDRGGVMADGRIAADGPVETVIDDRPLLARYGLV
jgi:cobalt/nickel transport system ATP-binding protein